ncbi:hypothetical protein FQR65_LT15593 [Abscondita terminalis]|nr:hypothetical protein FQR65_LT15593 [Abscondita terminalis]
MRPYLRQLTEVKDYIIRLDKGEKQVNTKPDLPVPADFYQQVISSGQAQYMDRDTAYFALYFQGPPAEKDLIIISSGRDDYGLGEQLSLDRTLINAGLFGLDNSSQALDIASIEYKFGKKRDWSVAIGKQSAMVGSYEFENNPIYEFMFTDYVDRILNLFVVGGKLAYNVNPDHSFHLQLYNTVNNTFDTHLMNNDFVMGDLKRAKAPVGGYFTWVGSFADQRLQTKWSYNLLSLQREELLRPFRWLIIQYR